MILLDHQNNYVGIKFNHNEQCCKKFSANPIVHNYFDSPTKLFSDLHLVRKLFFPYI